MSMLTRSLVLTSLRRIPLSNARQRRIQIIDRGWQHTSISALTFDYQRMRWLKTLNRVTNTDSSSWVMRKR